MKDLHYVREPEISQRDLRVKLLYHISVTNCALKFWRKGIAGADMFPNVDYNAQQDEASSNPNFTNVANNIPRLSTDEILMDNDHSESDWKPEVRLEQKSTDQMEESLCKFSKPGKLVLGPFAGILLTSNGFYRLRSSAVLLDRTRMFDVWRSRCKAS